MYISLILRRLESLLESKKGWECLFVLFLSKSKEVDPLKCVITLRFS